MFVCRQPYCRSAFLPRCRGGRCGLAPVSERQIRNHAGRRPTGVVQPKRAKIHGRLLHAVVVNFSLYVKAGRQLIRKPLRQAVEPVPWRRSPGLYSMPRSQWSDVSLGSMTICFTCSVTCGETVFDGTGITRPGLPTCHRSGSKCALTTGGATALGSTTLRKTLSAALGPSPSTHETTRPRTAFHEPSFGSC